MPKGPSADASVHVFMSRLAVPEEQLFFLADDLDAGEDFFHLLPHSLPVLHLYAGPSAVASVQVFMSRFAGFQKSSSSFSPTTLTPESISSIFSRTVCQFSILTLKPAARRGRPTC